MSVVDDHFAAFFALLQADPTLNPYDGAVPPKPAARYSLVYFYIETPDGLVAPDAVGLTMDSDVIDSRVMVHNVGATAQSARIQSGRSRALVLNQRLTITGRDCQPIRQREGQPLRRNEEIPERPVFDQVDTYSWRSVPA